MPVLYVLFSACKITGVLHVWKNFSALTSALSILDVAVRLLTLTMKYGSSHIKKRSSSKKWNNNPIISSPILKKKMQLDVGDEPYLSQQWCLDHLLTWLFLECSQWRAQTYGHVILMYLWKKLESWQKVTCWLKIFLLECSSWIFLSECSSYFSYISL